MRCGPGSGGEFVSFDVVLALTPARYAPVTAHAKYKFPSGHVARMSTWNV